MASSSIANGFRGPTSFADLDEFLSREIHILKVDNLKQLIQFLNSRHGYQIQKTKRKQELVDSVANVFREFRAKSQLDRYQAARAEFSRIAYPSYRGTVMANSYHGAGPAANGYGNTYSRAGASGTSYVPGYPVPAASYSSASLQNRSPQTANWKATPAWKVIKAVSDMTPVPAIDDDAQKKTSKTGTFQISADVLTQLKATPTDGKTKALRLFCTSSEYYPGDAVNVIPMDLPNNYDITLNSNQLKLAKGLKGKANSTAPVDLMQTTSLQTSALNKSSTVFNILVFSHTGPTMNKKTKTAKRFYFQVCLTEMTDSTAMRRVIVARRKTLNEVVQHMQSKKDEDDIEIGSARMSLKCPLSYIRIKTPIRSSRCTHMQCCDLDSWLMMNESTPSWTCPSCDQEMSLDQIFVDDFFNSILSTCPDSVDEILLESNGDWHTEDGKYASAGWKTANPMGPPPSARLLAGSKGPSRTATPELKIRQDSPAQLSTSKLAKEDVDTPPPPPVAHEIVELSDSDDDIVLPATRVVRRPSTPSSRPADLDAAISVSPSTARMINLGFDASNAISIDDSDDDEPIATTSTNMKDSQNGYHPTGLADTSANGNSGASYNSDQRKRPRSSPEKGGAGGDKRRRTASSSENASWSNSSPLTSSLGYGSNGDAHYGSSSDLSSPLPPAHPQLNRAESRNEIDGGWHEENYRRPMAMTSNDNFHYPGLSASIGNISARNGEDNSSLPARPLSVQGNTRTSFSSLPIYTSGSRPQVPTSSSYSKP